ncbi:MAG: 3-dehydroquinate synthase [Peptococcaceae bacterium]|nr:3-dehydroquinate synthase [Peptococcaceae bacterium]
MNDDKLTVDLGTRSYTIHVGHGLLGSVGDIVRGFFGGQRAMVITNPTVRNLYGESVRAGLEKAGIFPVMAEMPDGEEYKTLPTAARMYDLAYGHELDRQTPILALGGGVVGDLAGFVAATYLRGVPFVQIPTTLLAQVDSSVGGKVAVNHPQGKNIIGAFYQPAAVIADLAVLETLPAREIKAGLAEVIKYGVIADGEFFGWLEQNLEKVLDLEPVAMRKIVTVSCRIKAAVVREDETDRGVRAILNFGHTVGHAVESLTNYNTYKHGEAVAIGMSAAARMAFRMGLIGQQERDRVISLLMRAGLPVDVPAGLGKRELLRAMHRDKKVISSRLTFVLPVAVGKAGIFRDVGEDIINAGIGNQEAGIPPLPDS